jgi:hypothetical protein
VARGVRRPTDPSHVEAAVDPPYLAGDIPGGVGGEEMDHTCDLVRVPEAPHGDLCLDPIKELLRYGRDHLCADVARCDGVDRDADAVVVELSRAGELEQRLAGEALRQAEEARLRRGVVRLPDVARLPDG